MIVCWRTVDVPREHRERFLTWIDENREVREEHGILFEFVLERSARQGPAKSLQRTELTQPDGDLVVATAWPSHHVFDEWIETPDRDRLTASEVHNSVRFQPITRYAVAGGYLNLDGLTAVAPIPKEEP